MSDLTLPDLPDRRRRRRRPALRHHRDHRRVDRSARPNPRPPPRRPGGAQEQPPTFTVVGRIGQPQVTHID